MLLETHPTPTVELTCDCCPAVVTYEITPAMIRVGLYDEETGELFGRPIGLYCKTCAAELASALA